MLEIEKELIRALVPNPIRDEDQERDYWVLLWEFDEKRYPGSRYHGTGVLMDHETWKLYSSFRFAEPRQAIVFDDLITLLRNDEWRARHGLSPLKDV